MVWVYKSKRGSFSIRRLQNGRFGLYVGDEMLGSYHTPEAAADDVFMCVTGHDPWDNQLTVDYPADLGDWQQLR
jgi:hypothetical protein